MAPPSVSSPEKAHPYKKQSLSMLLMLRMPQNSFLFSDIFCKTSFLHAVIDIHLPCLSSSRNFLEFSN